MLKNVWNGGKDHALSGVMRQEMRLGTEIKNTWTISRKNLRMSISLKI